MILPTVLSNSQDRSKSPVLMKSKRSIIIHEHSLFSSLVIQGNMVKDEELLALPFQV